LQPVNHAVLAVVNPEQVEVEIWRSDELALVPFDVIRSRAQYFWTLWL